VVTPTETVTFQQVSARWSRVLGAASASTLGTALDVCLEDLGRFAAVDVAFVTLVDEDERVSDDWHWIRDGRDADAPAVGTELQATFASVVEFLRLGHHVAVDDVAEIELAPSERALADANGLRALVVVPVRIGEVLVGLAGLLVLDEPRRWERQLVEQLTLLAELLVRTVIRTRDRGAALLADVRARRISEFVPDGLVLLSTDGDVAWVSPSFVRMTGGDPGALVGRAFLDLLHPAHRDEVREAVLAAGDRAVALPARIRCGDDWRWSTLSIQLTSDPGSGVPDEVVVSVHDDHDQQVEARSLAEAAEHDPLTGTLNLAGLTRAVERLAEHGVEVLVAYCDLDGFKAVNDRNGHDVGDQVLRQVAAALQDAVRSDDVVARLGGDEFAVLIRDPGAVEDQEQFADRLVGAVAASTDPTITVSIGLAGPASSAEVPDLLSAADEAMYAAKRAGKGRWHRSSERPTG
jgi:diguanylate cyclase (GGDEF)-like protein/PAS domain S-box-containing protein